MRTAPAPRTFLLYAVFAASLMANIAFWSHARTVRESWGNVPSAPTQAYAGVAGLGDGGLSYRMIGYALQNFGNTGGFYESIEAYDFAALEKWMFLADTFDPYGNYVPFMAAYLFGATNDPGKTAHLVRYLRHTGAVNHGEKWRWLAQAVYKARYVMKDNALALEVAQELAALPNPDVAPWARQMPAFINLDMGNKEAAYGIMLQMLESEGNKLDPVEIRFMVDFICNRTLAKDETAKNPLCQSME